MLPSESKMAHQALYFHLWSRESKIQKFVFYFGEDVSAKSWLLNVWKTYSNGGFLNPLGLITHSMERSCLTKASMHISHLLFNLSIQHDGMEVMDHQYNVLWDVLKVQIT